MAFLAPSKISTVNWWFAFDQYSKFTRQSSTWRKELCWFTLLLGADHCNWNCLISPQNVGILNAGVTRPYNPNELGKTWINEWWSIINADASIHGAKGYWMIWWWKLHHMLWPLQSPDINPTKYLTFHCHQQNIKWGNMFSKNGAHPSSRVQRLCQESMSRSLFSCHGHPTP